MGGLGRQGRLTHARERDAQPGAVEPAQADVDLGLRFLGIRRREGGGVGAAAVVGDDEFRERAGGEDEGHDEEEVQPDPERDWVVLGWAELWLGLRGGGG